LGAPLGAKELPHLPGLYHLVGTVLFFGGLLALALTIVFSVVFVLRPVRHYALGADEIRSYVEDEFRTLKAIHPAVQRYETVNATKAAWLKTSAIVFLAGLLMTVGLAVTLALEPRVTDNGKRSKEATRPASQQPSAERSGTVRTVENSERPSGSLADTTAQLHEEGKALTDESMDLGERLLRRRGGSGDG
jgi:uncharacterized membrane protein YgdD (TMEM256/DUF423 family)